MLMLWCTLVDNSRTCATSCNVYWNLSETPSGRWNYRSWIRTKDAAYSGGARRVLWRQLASAVCHHVLLLFSVVHRLLLCRWDVADLGVQTTVVPPVDVLERGELDLLWRLPRPLAVDELGLVEADRRLGHRVVVRVAGSTDRRGDPGLGKTLRVACLLYTSPSPRDGLLSRMPSSA